MTFDFVTMSGNKRDRSMHIRDPSRMERSEPRPHPDEIIPLSRSDLQSESKETSRIYCPLSIDDAQPSKKSLFTTNFTKSEMDMFQGERSRTVKIFFLKFKCIIVFAVLLVAFLQFLFICFKEFMSNETAFDHAYKLLQTILQNSSALNSSGSDNNLLLV